MLRRLAFCAVLFAVGSNRLLAQETWATIAERDLRFMHAHMTATHPGTDNPDDPEFPSRLNEALEGALRLAAEVKTEAGYYWTVRRFLAAFNDLHVGVAQLREPEAVRWPGFEIDASLRVIASEGGGVPPVGATLLDCDGVPADSLAAERVGAAVGNWHLLGQRLRWTSRLFATSDPQLRPMQVCRFDVEGTPAEFSLAWRDGRLSDFRFSKRGGINQPGGSIRRHARLSPFGTNGYWVSLPNFRDVPGSSENASLDSVITQLSVALNGRSAVGPIILDVRGNGGGSDLWAHRVAAIIWGRDRTERTRERADYALRASAFTIVELEESLADTGSDMSAAERRDIERTLGRLRAAQERGEGLVRFADAAAPAAIGSVSGPSPKVLVLTDATCFSACLSAMDLWLALGAVHGGQETAADTRYLEVRLVPLPSGRGRFFSPTAILYRARGDNVPFVPVLPFTGDIADDAAVRSWLNAKFVPSAR